LLNEGNWDQFAENEFNIGDIWNIQFTNREDIEPPHVEDVVIRIDLFVCLFSLERFSFFAK
jgi:hypothetical protein